MSVRTLAESNDEALHALERFSQRLRGVLVNINEGSSSNGTSRSKRENLVNEEGLPFVEISEPVDELDTPSLTAASDGVVDDHHLEPSSTLSQEDLALSRQRRDKILQMLEEEEERGERLSEEQRREELKHQRELARKEMEKRMVNQGFELEKRRKAKDLEVRMARALVGKNGSYSKEGKPTTPSANQGKKVSFAEPANKTHDTHVQLNARSNLPISKQPMKMTVIERASASPPSKHEPHKLLAEERYLPITPRIEASIKENFLSSQTITFTNCGRDSDDESELDDNLDPAIAMEALDKDASISPRIHSELTVEYHKRRAAMKFELDNVLNPPSWNREDVPLKASLSKPAPKSSFSKFKQSRIKQFNFKSSSIGSATTFATTVIPPEVLTKHVRMGKVVNGQLIGGGEESD